MAEARRAAGPGEAAQGRPAVSGVDVVMVVVAALAEPLVLVAIVANLAKRGLLTAHVYKPGKPSTDPI